MAVIEMMSVQELEIADVNNDCLRKVFTYLSVGDLLNATDAHPRLRGAAKLAFIEKYAAKRFKLGKFYDSEKTVDIEEGDAVVIHTWKRTYQLLRCFGGSLSQLEILSLGSYPENVTAYSDRHCHLITYMNEYCSGALTGIKFDVILPCVVANLNKPYPMVKSVDIGFIEPVDSNLLNTIFPNMKSLNIKNIGEMFGIDSNFPCLEHANLVAPYRGIPVSLPTERAPFYSFLRLNPQIRSLAIPFLPDDHFLKTINESLPNLQSLVVDAIANSLLAYNGPVVHFKKVNALRFSLFHSLTLSPKFPFKFDQLKDFHIEQLFALGEDPLSTFLESHPTIEKISFNLCYFPRGQDTPWLARTLPKLKEADMRLICSYTIEKVCQFLDAFKELRTFIFELDESTDHNIFMKRPVNGWHFERITNKDKENTLKASKI